MMKKTMILCTGIKGVGVYDGELLINILQGRAHLPNTEFARHNGINAYSSSGKLYVDGSFWKPYSYSLSYQECASRVEELCKCLVMLNVFSEKQLSDRLTALKSEKIERDRPLKVEEFKRLCNDFKVKPTQGQLKRISK